MGKAVIISHAGKGQYVVDVEYDTDLLQSIIDQLQGEKTRLQFEDLVAAITERDAQQGDVLSAAAEVDLAIIDYNNNPTEENRKLIEEKTAYVLKISGPYQQALTQVQFVKSRIESLDKRIKIIRDNQVFRRRTSLWCVDLADGKKDRRIFDAGYEIATLELTGQEENGQVLAASYDLPLAQYDAVVDGRLFNVAGFSSFELFYNKAILPGWQKWRQRFHTGYITGGNPGDGWTITLDDVRSTEQNIQVNSFPPDGESGNGILTQINAVYMTCDNWAFGVGDHVVLDIIISGTPAAIQVDATIIGFVDNPRPCIVSGFGYYVTDIPAWQHVSDETGAWVMRTPITSDFITEQGTNPTVRSWIGTDVDNEDIVLEWAYQGSTVYWSGRRVANAPTDASWEILGAGITPDKKYLYAVMYDSTDSSSVWLMRKSLALDPLAGEENKTPRNVFLSAITYGSASINGEATVNDDKILSATLIGEAGISASLYVLRDWERQQLSIGSYAINGEFTFNASCTIAASMYNYTHGAKRTPQADPAPGATWDPTTSLYDDTWKEKITITIDNPSADSLVAANVQIEHTGRQGYNVLSSNYYLEWSDYSGDGVQIGTLIWERTLSGTYQTEIGFNGDEQIDIGLKGFGFLNEYSNSVYDGTVWNSDVDYEADWGLEYYGITVPGDPPVYRHHRVDKDTGTYTNNYNGSPGDHRYATREFTVTNDYPVGTKASDKITAIGGFERHYTGVLEYTTFPTWTSYETLTDDDSAKVIIGGVMEYVSTVRTQDITVTDTPPTMYVFGAGDTVTYTPPGITQEQTLLDVTGHPIDQWTSLLTFRSYQTFQAVRAGGQKYAGQWKHNFNVPSTFEAVSFLTGGDLSVLDETPDPVTYQGIHPT